MATLTVTTNASSGTGSLSQAISNAADGDTITFSSSVFQENQITTILATSNYIFSVSKQINLVGLVDSSGRPFIALDFQDSYKWYFGTTKLVVNNLIIKRGKYTETNTTGGPIYVGNNQQFVATNCFFLNNTSAFHGGAICVEKTSASGICSATFTNCVFDGNRSDKNGGAVNIGGFGRAQECVFNSCIFKNNTSAARGSVLQICDYSTVSIQDCTFNNNTSLSGYKDIDIYTATYNRGSNQVTLNILGGNVFSLSGSASSNSNFIFSGYNGIKAYSLTISSSTISGSGFLALPSTASVTLPNTITRTIYGAGVSNLAVSGDDLTWSSTDSTKSVLLEKQNGANWDTVSTSATSPTTVSSVGTYRIWDGETFLTCSSPPQTLVVTNTNDSGSGSLRAVLASARAVDTITFDASLSGSTITLASGLTLSDAVEIVGLVDANGDPAITISGANTYRILSGNYQMTLSNLIFANAGNNAIYNEDAAGSSFTNCVFSNNSATDSYGGAVLLTGNNANTENVTFTDCVFTGNESLKTSMLGFGGALTTQNISATLTGCTFTGNKAYGGYGGALALFSPAASYTLTDCVFTGNSIPTKSASTYMSDQGGAVRVVGTSTFTRCSFTNNSADDNYDGDQGGAVYVGNNSSFTDCTFSGNSVAFDGGAIYADYAVVNLSGCTFSGNTATNGADYCGDTSSDLTVPSGIVTIPNVYIKSGAETSIANGAALSISNSATILGAVSGLVRAYLATPPGTDLTGATLTNIVSCDYGAGVSAFSIDEDSANWTAVNSNISVLLEKKVNGAWQTLAQPTGTSYSTTFVDGDEARIFDGVQFRTASAIVPTTIVVTNTNATGAGSLAQAVLDARAVDTITFDPSLAGETITLNAGLGPRNEVTIVGLVDDDGKPTITVDAGDNFAFDSSYPVHISNVAFDGGWGAFSSLGGFDGSTFENCTFTNMSLNVFELDNSSADEQSLSFTNCDFFDNDLADVAIIGDLIEINLDGGNTLREGFDCSSTTSATINNADYNGVGAYTAPSAGTVTLDGSGHIALPSGASLAPASASLVASVFSAGVSDFAAENLTISWNSVDSTKSVLLQVQNGADWDDVTTTASSPYTVQDEGTYRIWDGEIFLTVNAVKVRYWIISSGAIDGNVWRVKSWAATRGDE